MTQTNRYVQYYLDQQQGNGMPVFIGRSWQRGHGAQIGFGIGGLFRSVARAVMPMVKSGAKTLGNIALNTGANFVGDVLSGKNVKESAKARVKEAANTVKRKAANKIQSLSQTGSGKRVREQLKRERQRLLLPEANKPRNGKQLTLKTYSDNYEFRTSPVSRVPER